MGIEQIQRLGTKRSTVKHSSKSISVRTFLGFIELGDAIMDDWYQDIKPHYVYSKQRLYLW